MNNSAKRYTSKLKRTLPCTRATKAKLLEEFSHLLDGFLDENPDATYADLSNAFGPPEEMAEALMEKVSEQEKRAFGHRRLVRRIVAAILAIALLILTAHTWIWKEKPIIVDSGVVVDETFDIPDSTAGE